MYHFSQHELDMKIQAFKTKKMKEFPGLDEELSFIADIEPIEKRDAVSRKQVFPILRLNAQY